MSQGSEANTVPSEVAVGESKALQVIRESNGLITKSSEFKKMLFSLLSDILEGSVTPRVSNAVCNASGKVLKLVELEQRYGRPAGSGDSGPASNPQLSLQ